MSLPPLEKKMAFRDKVMGKEEKKEERRPRNRKKVYRNKNKFATKTLEVFQRTSTLASNFKKPKIDVVVFFPGDKDVG